MRGKRSSSGRSHLGSLGVLLLVKTEEIVRGREWAGGKHVEPSEVP